MKEVIWVFGLSASGKETFIKYISASDDTELLSKLGLSTKRISFSTNSLKLIGGELDEQRDSILSEVQKLLSSSDVILIKWQFVDSIAKRPQKLKLLLPTARHKIICLVTDVDEIAKRLPHKPLWRQPGKERQLAKAEIPKVLQAINELYDFDITYLNSNDNAGYTKLNRFSNFTN